MRDLKVEFVDFWPGFRKDNNYFFHLLDQKYNVILDGEDPDLLFFSVDYAKAKERERFKNHPCKKIFYSGENVRPNFGPQESLEYPMYSIGKCDLAFTFDFSADPRHYRLPLWALHIDWFDKTGYINPKYLIPFEEMASNHYIDHPRTEFCASIFSNPVPMRVDMFKKLSAYKPVHGYGKPFGNWTDGEDHKYKILSHYKFSICFENSISPVGGYYTEKLFHARVAGTLPIYWSDSSCSRDFNPKGFLNLSDYDSMDSLIDRVIEIDNNDALYESYIAEPFFSGGEFNPKLEPASVLNFIQNSITIEKC